jgi:hypothetical protein
VNLADDERSDAWSAVDTARRERDLQRELFLTDAVDVATEAHAILRRAEVESMRVAGELRNAVRAEEIRVIAK